MSTRHLAKHILAGNAITSGVSGAALILFPSVMAELVFTAPAKAHLAGSVLVGIGLVIFAVDVALIAKDRFLTSKDLFLISVADDAWVVASVAALALFSEHFTPLGWNLVALSALGVAGFAVAQTIAGLKLEKPESRFQLLKKGRGLEISVKRPTEASAEIVWRVMTDHPGYADVADNLSKVEVLGGEGENARRKCYGPKGESWSETCDLYRENEVYGFNVHTEAADYPYPFKKVKGRWSVQPVGKGSEFTIVITVEPKNGFTSFMMRMVGFRNIRALMINLADRWAERMEREDRDPVARIAAE